MSISANKLVYDFERKLNAANSSRNKNYRIVDIVSYLNEGYEIWYENKVYAADTNSKIRNDLRVFEIKKKALKCRDVDCDCCKAKYPLNLYKVLNVVVKACNEECCPGLEKDIVPKIVQSDDLQIARKNKYWESSFKWEQLIADEAGDYLYFYHEGKMDLTNVYIDYYRKPKYIQAPDLVECEDHIYWDYDRKLINTNIDFEVEATYGNRQVSDIAVLLASRDSGNPTQFETQLKKILSLDKLYR